MLRVWRAGLTRLAKALKERRGVSFVAGVCLLLLALWSYQRYSSWTADEGSDLRGVPRLQVVEFKAMYDKFGIAGDNHTTTPLLSREVKSDARDELYVIDVRSDAQYLHGHIRGAVSIPEAEIEARIGSIVSPSHSTALIVL